MNYTIIIPARLASTRLPNKMLLPLQGKPVIEWSWLSAQKSEANTIIIATDSQQIFTHMEARGATVVMTRTDHETGTDRLSEVVHRLNIKDDEIIVNWQGDEPFLPANLVSQVAQALFDNQKASMSTLATKIDQWEEVNDPNIVKVVCNQKNEALYFSRSPIPYPRDIAHNSGKIPDQYTFLRHIGVYGYRASYLKIYPSLPQSPLEKLEKLEQLRALTNHAIINVSQTHQSPPNGIDTHADLESAKLWLSTIYKE